MGGLENPFVHYECERMFCEKCIKKVDRCPLCRKKLFEQTLSEVRVGIIKNMLNDLKVYCPLDKQHQINRGDYFNHVNDSPHKCHLNCGKFVSNTNLNNHKINDCPEFVINCDAFKYCLTKIPRKDMEQHIKDCKYIFLLPIIDEIKQDYQKQIDEMKKEFGLKWVPVNLLNNLENEKYDVPAYCKDIFGIVHLKGFVKINRQAKEKHTIFKL